MGMQHQAGAAVLYLRGCVQPIAPNRVADGLQVNPQLVGTPCEGLQF